MLPENMNENQIKNWAQNELNLELNEALIHEMLKKRCLQQVLNYVVCKVKNKRNAQKFSNHAKMFKVLQQIDVNNQQFKDVINNNDNNENNEPSLFQWNMMENFDQFYADLIESDHVKTMIDKFDHHNEMKNIAGLIEQLQRTKSFESDSRMHSFDSTAEIAKTIDMNLKDISDLYRTIQTTAKENRTKINQLDDDDVHRIESSNMMATMNDLKDRLHQIQSSTLSWMIIIDNFIDKN